MHLTSNFSTKNKPAYHTFLKGSHSNTFSLLDFAYLKDPFQLTFEYHSNVLCAQLAQVLVCHGCWGRSGPRFLHTCYGYWDSELWCTVHSDLSQTHKKHTTLCFCPFTDWSYCHIIFNLQYVGSNLTVYNLNSITTSQSNSIVVPPFMMVRQDRWKLLFPFMNKSDNYSKLK